MSRIIVKTPKRRLLEAGNFSAWLHTTRKALVINSGIDVACGDCIGCCSSSYFIHIGADESESLSKIPDQLLFPAPGQPAGNVLMGYDELGRCPMLIDSKCSIYDHRPLTCKTYDCRVFTATGLPAGGDEKVFLNEQIKCWQFDYPTGQARNEQAALLVTVEFLHDHANSFPDNFIPNNTTQLAILAIKVYEVFLNDIDKPVRTQSDSEVVKQIIVASKKFNIRQT